MAKILIKGGRVWDGERSFYADLLTDGDVCASGFTANIQAPSWQSIAQINVKTAQ